MKNMRQWNYVIAGAFGAFGAYIMYMASKMKIELGTGDPGSGFWPFMLGCLLVGMAAILLLSAIFKGKKMAEKKVDLTTSAHKRVYVMMAFAVVYCVILYFGGFYIASLIFIPSAMYLLGSRDKKKMALVAVCSVLAVYVVFGILLKTELPPPIFLR